MKKVRKSVALLGIFISAIILPKHTTPTKTTPYHNIVTHIHYIKCLSKSTYVLSRLYKQHYYYKPCNCIEQKDCIQVDSTNFSHKKMRDCLQKMVLTGSLKPLLVLLREVKNYRLLQDNLFFHEFFLLIFTVHKQILFHESEENPHALKHTTFETIIDISNKINQLPIAEVLSAIDMLVTELPAFLEKYEFHSKITWQEWLKKYWWVPPVFGAWFGLKILLRLQRPQFFYSSPYLAPRPQIPLEPIVLVEPTELTNPVLLEIRQNKKD